MQEWWPKAGDVTDGKQNWPSTLPPMGGALDCSPYAEENSLTNVFNVWREICTLRNEHFHTDT